MTYCRGCGRTIAPGESCPLQGEGSEFGLFDPCEAWNLAHGSGRIDAIAGKNPRKGEPIGSAYMRGYLVGMAERAEGWRLV